MSCSLCRRRMNGNVLKPKKKINSKTDGQRTVSKITTIKNVVLRSLFKK